MPDKEPLPKPENQSTPINESLKGKVDLQADCSRLMQRFADFTHFTGDQGFSSMSLAESYRTLPLKYKSAAFGDRPPFYDSALEEGKPPFTDKTFHFMVLERRDQNTLPELDQLPKWKIILPIDSRCHYGYGRVEFYEDSQGKWKVVKHDLRPTREILEQKLTEDPHVAVAEVIKEEENAEANAELEKQMGVTGELAEEDMANLHKLLENPVVLEDPSEGNFLGKFKIINSHQFFKDTFSASKKRKS